MRATRNIIMAEEEGLTPAALLKLQSWLSPAFPVGAYSYSHGLEWAVEAGHVGDLETLVSWLQADLCHGTGRNEGIFFKEAWQASVDDDSARLLATAEWAAALRGTAEFALEATQQAGACLATLQRVWPDPRMEWLATLLRERDTQPTLAVVLAVRTAAAGIPLEVALPAFLQSQIANWVTAGVRLIPLGQTAGQHAIAALESAVLACSAQVSQAPLEELGSAAFMVDLASMAHETQYTRLFRS